MATVGEVVGRTLATAGVATAFYMGLQAMGDCINLAEHEVQAQAADLTSLTSPAHNTASSVDVAGLQQDRLIKACITEGAMLLVWAGVRVQR